MIVPGGGISPDGERWVACRPDFLVYVGVLSRLFRRLVLEKLAVAHRAGELQFFGKHASLTNTRAFTAYLAPLRNKDWIVYAKRPFGGPEEVLRYLARYGPGRVDEDVAILIPHSPGCAAFPLPVLHGRVSLAKV